MPELQERVVGSGEMTRQRLWQLKMRAQGRCLTCGTSSLTTRAYCAEHSKKISDLVSRRNALTVRDPERMRARALLAGAIRRGEIHRPAVCSRCGVSDPKINGHHHDYAKPLDVTWLCYSCHAAVENRTGNIPERAAVLKAGATFRCPHCSHTWTPRTQGQKPLVVCVGCWSHLVNAVAV